MSKPSTREALESTASTLVDTFPAKQFYPATIDLEQ